MFKENELLQPSEENFLNDLQSNYQNRRIYSQCGIILLSINPFSDVKIYDKNVMKAYYKNYGTVEPHIYSVAENAIQNLEVNGNQTIIVSGESGSGKTVNSKHLLKYIIWRCSGTKSLEELLIASHFVLECFGNAKTQINENSSRFGKYLTLFFDKNKIVGGNIQEYLLEKSRVTHQSQNNKNFHIFYMMCAGRKLNMKNDYIDAKFNDEDHKKYLSLKETFEKCELYSFEKLENQIVAVLKLGSLEFKEMDSALIIKNKEILDEVCSAFNLNYEKIEKSLCKKTLNCKTEFVERYNSLEKAKTIRDTLARNLYAKIFKEVIESINCKIKNNENYKSSTTISILDIYGFEVFEENGFDQFCINWANERIQNEFVKRMFIERQEFYKKENIDWPSEINFTSNSEIIKLIEGKLGIVDLIEEESYNPCGNVEGLHLKLRKFNSAHANFLKTPSKNSIKIKHFAYPVEYSLENFLEKNIETATLETSESFKKNKSVLKFFIDSMNELFKIINKTTIHYIRCIRPNTNNTSWNFDRNHISNQLKACGIKETIELSQKIYPHIISKKSFFSRYKLLKNLSEHKYLEGKTNVFLKNETLKTLEKERSHEIEIVNKKLGEFISNFLLKNTIAKLEQHIELKKQKPFCNFSTENTKEGCIDSYDEFLCDQNSLKSNLLDNFDINNYNNYTKEEIQQEILNLKKKIQKVLNFYKDPCSNCTDTNLKYQFQTEELKKAKVLESEIIQLKSMNEKLEKEISMQKDLIREMTMLANEVRKDETSETKNFFQLAINLNNPHEIFACLLELYIENAPSFSTTKFPTDELLSLGHLVYKIITELSKRSESKEEVYLEIFLYELNEIIHKIDTNIHKVTFILANLLELRSLTKPTNELTAFIKSLFEHLCELHKDSISNLLPDSILYHQSLDNFRCEDNFYKKYFNHTPSTLKLINQIDYLCTMMDYFGITIPFVKESLRYLIETINSSCFNRILVEQKFLSFNRCTQINFNLNEIIKFCQEIGFTEGNNALKNIKDVVMMIFLLLNKADLNTIKEECTSLNLVQLNSLFGKLDGIDISFEVEVTDEQMNLFLDDPKLNIPNIFEKKNFTFCLPRYLPSKQITGLLSSI